MTTLREIASLANVSTTTVSKVLNGDFRKVSSETKERILAIARERHYYPNRMAKGLAERKSHMIGLLLPSISNPFYAEMARGITNFCEPAGYVTVLFNTDEREDREVNYINTLAGYRADGVMLIGSERTVAGNIVLLKQHGIPYVVVDSHTVTPAYNVIVNDFSGVYRMTKLLIDNGHRNIAFISGQGYISDEKNPRLEGYRAAMQDFGVAVNPLMIEMGAYTVQSGYEKAQLLLSRGLDITALVCGNDLIAVGAYQAVRQRDMKVPRDISVTGYDDIFISDILDPPLTTVRSPVYDMGVAAASMLYKRIHGQLTEPAVQTFEPTIVQRGSVGLPRNGV